MKLAIVLFAVLIISEECNQSKSEQTNDNSDVSVSYQAISRGFFKQLTFKNAHLLYSEDPNEKIVDTFKLATKEWNEILALSSKINLENIENLKAPTSKRLYDGAAHTNISIFNKSKRYVSPTFDEGYPPEEIKALVNKMLTISEKYLQP